MERIEDEIFASALETSGIKRTKAMYERALFPHWCTMCYDKDTVNYYGYRLKPEFVSYGEDTPYLFICDECYEELPNE